MIAHLYWMYVVSARSNNKSLEIWTITIARITLSLLVIIYFLTRGSGSSVNYSRSESESDVGYEMRIQREEQQAISSRKSADQANTRNSLLLAALFGLVIHKYGFESPGAYFKRRNIFGLSSV